ncbi:Rossmann-fold NAD(P)-binding domain-containing protein [Picrophilus oshimae]|uniref:Ornithine cyclodeaminase n=1 Tax=Picrophilus torridus (strain ATCC 700027 / DSM 9790 / JCM 10055 / NBRC 100828 / KAW 2/3) TaxID=1122961 RepID=A0A8G2L756_PICTO|nr:ornithine cyclodeaminase [Picrophilus oshimae]SMD30732.1 ornithine cyclodeaminase [Picrophilus oshimae DSM 9789]
MITYISDDDVLRHLNIKECIGELKTAFESYGAGESNSSARDRIFLPGHVLNTMPAYYSKRNLAGLKTYIAGKNGIRFIVLIFNVNNPEDVFVFDANMLGRIRTGALTAMVTSLIVKKNGINFTLIGSGFQAETQYQAMASIYNIKRGYVYSKNFDHARAFAERFGLEPVNDLKCLRDSDVITSITNSDTPIFNYDMLPEHFHVNLAGSNMPGRREADHSVINNADIIIVEHMEQALRESSEIIESKNKNMVELKDFIKNNGSYNRTVFKSMGIGLEDLAAGYLVLKDMKLL